jgi:hypothetical protein
LNSDAIDIHRRGKTDTKFLLMKHQ